MKKSPIQADLSWWQRLAALRNLKGLFALLWATSPRLLCSTVSLRILRAAMPALLLWLPKLILDELLAVNKGHGNRHHIMTLLILEFILAALADCLSRANNLLDSLLGDKFTNHVATRLLEHATLLDLCAFEDPVFYDKLERVRGGAGGRLTLLASLWSLGQESCTLAILLIGLFVFSPWLLCLVGISTIPAFVGESHFSRLAYSIFFRRSPQRRELDYWRFLGTCAEAAKEVRIFGLGHLLCDRYRDAAERIYHENTTLAIKRASSGAALGLLYAAGYYGGYFIVLGRALARSISIGTFTFLTGSFGRARVSAERILGNFADISEQAVLLTDLFEFFQLQPRITSAKDARPVARPIQRGFQLINVSFAYPGSDRLILKDINLTIGASERVALVGENGAGKTTLVKLLARLYDPSAGRILLDGVDLCDYDLESVRSRVSVVFQDFMRYDLTVRDNVGFGSIAALSDSQAISSAVRKAGADKMIASLPAGIDQVLGRRFEGGVDLSGGEWQKVALARAHVKDASLLILDEPTASLDARSEHEVFMRFAELIRGRMAVLISHRLSTVRAADRIVVLEHGTICEQGSHDELLALRGRYAELFELQASGFRDTRSVTSDKSVVV